MTGDAKGQPLFRLQVGLLSFLCFSATAFPRLLPTLLGLVAIIAAIRVLKVDPKRPLVLLCTPVGIALCLFVAYVFVNATWAPDLEVSFAKAGAVFGLVMAAFVIAAFFSLCSPIDAQALASWALLGLLLGVTFLLVELALGEPIKLFVTNNIVQLFDLNPKKARVVDGHVTRVSAFLLNRNVMTLVLLLIPGLLFTAALPRLAMRKAVIAGLSLGAAICVLLSESGTSVMAFFLGSIVLGLCALSLKAVRVGLMVIWTIVVLFAVPLSALPYELGWNRWTWLPPRSVAARVYIWKHMADEVGKHPIIGVGVRGSRALEVRLPANLKTLREPNPVADGRLVPHPHNIFLQIWLELGAIGAFLAAGLGLVALWQIGRLPRLVQAGGYGLFAACATVGASGFELWQTWLFTAYVFAWAALMLAPRLPLLAPPASGSPPD